MKKFFKKSLITCLGVVILLGIAISANAQTNEYVGTSLYVTDLSLNKGTYSPGEEVTGSFIVHNINSFDVNDANYVVSLAADYIDGGIPSNLIDSSDRIELPFMTTKSRTTVNFTYKLPTVVGGNDFGINVRSILDSGLELGWDDALFNMVGESLSLVDIKSASILVLEEHFAVGTGPTVYPEDGATLEVIFSNPTEEIEVTPHIIIKSQFNNNVVHDKKLEKITLIANSDLEYSFLLPVEYIPGVYLGELQLLDSNGINRISNLQFRYIVGGEIGTIQNINTNTLAVKKGDVLPLSINVTGTPIDIVRASVDDSEDNAKLDITIKDGESDKVVGSSSLDLEALNNKTHDIDIIIKKSVENIVIEAVLLGSDNQILDEYTVSLPAGELPEGDNMLINSILIIVGLIVIIVTAIMVKKKLINQIFKQEDRE